MWLLLGLFGAALACNDIFVVLDSPKFVKRAVGIISTLNLHTNTVSITAARNGTVSFEVIKDKRKSLASRAFLPLTSSLPKLLAKISSQKSGKSTVVLVFSRKGPTAVQRNKFLFAAKYQKIHVFEINQEKASNLYAAEDILGNAGDSLQDVLRCTLDNKRQITTKKPKTILKRKKTTTKKTKKIEKKSTLPQRLKKAVLPQKGKLLNECSKDIILLFDSSRGTFKFMPKYVKIAKEIVAQLAGNVQLGILRYSSSSRQEVVLPLRSLKSKATATRALSFTDHLGGTTKTAQALSFTLKQFANARAFSAKHVLLFTDGWSQENPSGVAAQLRHRKISISVIAVSDIYEPPNTEEIGEIADDPKHVFLDAAGGQIARALRLDECRG